ncbi:Hsp20/alpha crystallin family protein [Microvirga sp. STR05]|uniref:Hsp20 family protein n=2 Tax=Hymenobacter TaxID=89966 RepID=A0A7G7W7R1_9BACT|nr:MULTISPECIES: Hsp20/alpha crystallin family protein [Hymenobacter]MBD2717143.1 Hsp20 family protein [Hymenobacter duratus]MBR7952059.1 Hsp20/alpha crystallin family protein [Microvirga sp. STR05]QNH62404.1 Hsp20 family protein [Hymenobacter sediminicola]
MNLISREFIRNLAPQLDLLNTLGGGIAQAQLRVDKQEQGVVIRVAAPSVSPENIHVVLKNSRLSVFGEFRHQPEDQLAAPLFTRVLDLPADLDLTRIDAVHEQGELRVRIPYADPTSQQREIKIKQR